MGQARIRGLTLIALVAASPALAQEEPPYGAPAVLVTPAPPMRAELPSAPTLAVDQGMLDADAYRPLGYGARLPRSWMQTDHHIAVPSAHGLQAPAPGFGWSRYHNDAVLTDQWGRVYATRTNVDWARPDRRYTQRRTSDGVAGGVGGAAVGAVAGNLIAGSGSRLAGSLIGGGVGALVGIGVELLTKRRGGSAPEAAHALHWTDDGPYDDAAEDEIRTVTTTYPGERVCTPRATFAATSGRARPSRAVRYSRRAGD